MSESDVCRRQILTSKVDPRAVSVPGADNIQIDIADLIKNEMNRALGPLCAHIG